MADVVGGNLQTLASLKRELDTQAEAAQQLKSAIDGALNETVWTGANSDRFRQAWEEFKPTFDKLQEELTQASTDVAKQHNNLAMAVGENVQI